MSQEFNKTEALGAAKEYARKGKLQEAIWQYEKIVQVAPQDFTVLGTMADLCARLGQPDRATECYKRAGDSYARDGFTVKAISMYKKIIKLNPGVTEYIQRLGELYERQGLYIDACRQYSVVADQFINAGHLDAAHEILQRMAALIPQDEAVQSKLTTLRRRMNRATDVTVEEQITRYAYGEPVTAEEEIALKTHIAQCGACEEFVRFVRKSRAVVRSQAISGERGSNCPSTEVLRQLEAETLNFDKARVDEIRRHVLNCRWCRDEYFLISNLASEKIPDHLFEPEHRQESSTETKPERSRIGGEPELLRLKHELQQYSRRLDSLLLKRFPSEDEKIEKMRLKKLKLQLEEQIEALEQQVLRGKNRLA